jgi:hypothetical protein
MLKNGRPAGFPAGFFVRARTGRADHFHDLKRRRVDDEDRIAHDHIAESRPGGNHFHDARRQGRKLDRRWNAGADRDIEIDLGPANSRAASADRFANAAGAVTALGLVLGFGSLAAAFTLAFSSATPLTALSVLFGLA